MDAKVKDKSWKMVQDLRKDVNNLGELVKTILDGGGAEVRAWLWCTRSVIGQ